MMPAAGFHMHVHICEHAGTAQTHTCVQRKTKGKLGHMTPFPHSLREVASRIVTFHFPSWDGAPSKMVMTLLTYYQSK